jgi:hypothetical protein
VGGRIAQKRAVVAGTPGSNRRRPHGRGAEIPVAAALSDAFAKVAREHPDDPPIAPLTQLLRRHDAALRCQYDAFANYVKEAEAKGVEAYPLYLLTKKTVDDPVKEAKYTKSFALHVGGDEVYERRKADALQAELKPLVGGSDRGADVQV